MDEANIYIRGARIARLQISNLRNSANKISLYESRLVAQNYGEEQSFSIAAKFSLYRNVHYDFI